MSWAKQSVEVGLAGLTQREAARGALTCPEFQGMPDPLDPYGLVVKEEDVSTPFINCAVFVFVEHVKQQLVYCTVLIFRIMIQYWSQIVGSSWGRTWGLWLSAVRRRRQRR